MLGYRSTDELCALSSEQAGRIFVAPSRQEFLADFGRMITWRNSNRKSGGRMAARDGLRKRRVRCAVRMAPCVGLRGQVRDISERKTTGAKLAASEQRYRALFDHSAIGIVEYDYAPRPNGWSNYGRRGFPTCRLAALDPEGLRSASARVKVVTANDATLRLAGLEKRGGGQREAGADFGGGRYDARARRSSRSGRATPRPTESCRPNRGGRQVETHLSLAGPLIDGRPHYERTQLVLVDLHGDESLASGARGERERLRVTLRAMSEAVVTIDTEGTVHFMNDAAAELTGWPPAAANRSSAARGVCAGFGQIGSALAAPVATALEHGSPLDFRRTRCASARRCPALR
jgi:PAS domain-containing protein